MNSYEQKTTKLLAKYEEIMAKKSPDWAVRKRNSTSELVRCTIPFVGKNYEAQEKKILVYASAENLSGYYPGNKGWEGDWLDDDEQAENRHRRCFERENTAADFFPHVHLQPMNNGCLATAVYYIANKLLNVSAKTPCEFYETIAFANYGKYSIETKKQRSLRLKDETGGSGANIDYAGRKELLEISHDFISADISELKPDFIIIPKSIYDADKVFIDSVKGDAVIVPIYQINAGVINRHIAKSFDKYDEKGLSADVRTWYNAMEKDGMGKGSKTKENYLAVFSHLDDVIKNKLIK